MSIQEILNLIQLLALVIISGGTLVIGALVAPTLFANLCREEASTIMIVTFGKFDCWIKFSALTLAIAKFLELILVHKFNFMLESGTGEAITKVMNGDLINSIVLVMAITAISLYIAFKLSPAIIQSFEDDSNEFRSLHKQSEIMHRINFLLSIFLLTYFI